MMTSGLSPSGTTMSPMVMFSQLNSICATARSPTDGGYFDMSDIGIRLSHGVNGLELTRKQLVFIQILEFADHGIVFAFFVAAAGKEYGFSLRIQNFAGGIETSDDGIIFRDRFPGDKAGAVEVGIARRLRGARTWLASRPTRRASVGPKRPGLRKA